MRPGGLICTGAAALAVAVAGCGGGSYGGGGGPTTGGTTAPKGTTGATPAPVSGRYAPKIDPANFVANIDNHWLPYRPGRTARLEGVAEDGKTPQTDIETVTNVKKKIMGVECTVIRDAVYESGKAVERTDDWYAQDRQGNVWYFGEDSFELQKKGGRFVKGTDSWEAGVDGAQPGIIMLADPKPGRQYRQEYYIGHAEDQARVIGPGGAVKVPAGSYPQTLVTLEYSNIDKQYEKKWYAPGVGEIKEAVVKGGSKERFELAKTTG